MAKIFLGVIPTGYDHTAIGEADLAAIKAAAAVAAMEERRRVEHEALRAEAPKKTNRARMMRRFRRALAGLGRLK
jgi:hypothetical protein